MYVVCGCTYFVCPTITASIVTHYSAFEISPLARISSVPNARLSGTRTGRLRLRSRERVNSLQQSSRPMKSTTWMHLPQLSWSLIRFRSLIPGRRRFSLKSRMRSRGRVGKEEAEKGLLQERRIRWHKAAPRHRVWLYCNQREHNIGIAYRTALVVELVEGRHEKSVN